MPLLGIRTKSNKTFTLNWKPLSYWAIKTLLKVKTRYSNIIVRKKDRTKNNLYMDSLKCTGTTKQC